MAGTESSQLSRQIVPYKERRVRRQPSQKPYPLLLFEGLGPRMLRLARKYLCQSSIPPWASPANLGAVPMQLLESITIIACDNLSECLDWYDVHSVRIPMSKLVSEFPLWPQP